MTSDDGDEARLRRLLDVPETAWIVARVRKRMERGRSLSGTVTLAGATESQRAAVGRLLGRSVPRASSVSVSLERLDEVLRTSGAWPDGLASAVVTLTGPVDDPQLRRADDEAWRAATAQLDDLAARHPELAGWIDGVRSRGRLRRAVSSATEAMQLVQDIRAVVDALPADGESIAGFSARVLHDAHALDADTPLGTIAASAVEALGGPGELPYGSAAWRRSAWASVGVLVDDLSSNVLTIGLPGGTSTATARALAAMTAAGQPAILTLRQVIADDPGVIPAKVSVCENPAVVSAAADRLGADAAPLVCVRGQPGAAAITLLLRLHGGGSAVRYHGDFDWGGVSIARTLATRVRWYPWRFNANDYTDAVARHPRRDALPHLADDEQSTPWDPELAEAMRVHRVRIEEELVLDTLLDDLALK
ncbi:uncharacterized protein (TIGR02679 family) [Haloactinopolyspora alba]|uniref:Uncharacterized protein (TIGR02679 family) n=1 Tax=Haloactinopolyspora alba TaxID=648780 RepID=A0A2P8EBL3_9ACTN|nr:TIGR02679 family protein [Haloactinopolyspora alba]PSL06856.1 uncharacterized protein (TIGR02679 family) [Haloactinopolyspora alba]